MFHGRKRTSFAEFLKKVSSIKLMETWALSFYFKEEIEMGIYEYDMVYGDDRPRWRFIRKKKIRRIDSDDVM